MLTVRQKLFVEEYMRYPSAKDAAIRVGYNPERASIIGAMLLRKLEICALIEQKRRERKENSRI